MKKRSISLYGHQTSVALEPEFWAVIDAAVAESGQSFASFIRQRDDERMEGGPTRNLASHLRIWCLSWVQGSIMNNTSSQLTLSQDDFDELMLDHDQNTLTHVRSATIGLSVYRQHIMSGGTVHLKIEKTDRAFGKVTQFDRIIESVPQFDDWTLTNFPFCKSLYPYNEASALASRRKRIAKRKTEITLTNADYKWIRQAYDYGNVTPLTAAAKRLTIFRNHIMAGGRVKIRAAIFRRDIKDLNDFDLWVDIAFPDYASGELYPSPNLKMTLAEFRDEQSPEETSPPEFEYIEYTRPEKLQTILGRWAVEANIRKSELEATQFTQTDIKHACNAYATRVKADEHIIFNVINSAYKVFTYQFKDDDDWFADQELAKQPTSQELLSYIDNLHIIVYLYRGEFFAKLSIRPKWDEEHGLHFSMNDDCAWEMEY